MPARPRAPRSGSWCAPVQKREKLRSGYYMERVVLRSIVRFPLEFLAMECNNLCIPTQTQRGARIALSRLSPSDVCISPGRTWTPCAPRWVTPSLPGFSGHSSSSTFSTHRPPLHPFTPFVIHPCRSHLPDPSPPKFPCPRRLGFPADFPLPWSTPPPHQHPHQHQHHARIDDTRSAQTALGHHPTTAPPEIGTRRRRPP
jgi:hypothetical protein